MDKKEKKLCYTSLYKEFVSLIGRKISERDFSAHLTKMVEEDWLNREEIPPDSRGGKVFYFITENGMVCHKLKIDVLNQGKYERAYQLLFLYAVFGKVPPSVKDADKCKLDDEKQLIEFLSELNLSIHNLDTKENLIAKTVLHTEECRVIRMNEPIYNIEILKIYYPQGSALEGSYSYFYILPGISITEFLRERRSGMMLEHISFTNSEVEESFSLLENQGLIKEIMRFRNERRFDISSEPLKNFIKDCHVLNGMVSMRMRRTWEYIRPEKPEERKWWYDLWGDGKRTGMSFRDFGRKRRSYTKTDRERTQDMIRNEIKNNWDKGIIKKHKEINRKYNDSVLKKYRYPSYSLIRRIAYPKFIELLLDKGET